MKMRQVRQPERAALAGRWFQQAAGRSTAAPAGTRGGACAARAALRQRPSRCSRPTASPTARRLPARCTPPRCQAALLLALLAGASALLACAQAAPIEQQAAAADHAAMEEALAELMGAPGGADAAAEEGDELQPMVRGRGA